jgi:hypothetical protein
VISVDVLYEDVTLCFQYPLDFTTTVSGAVESSNKRESIHVLQVCNIRRCSSESAYTLIGFLAPVANFAAQNSFYAGYRAEQNF